MTPELHINIDHIATIRQARKALEPSPLEAVKILESTKASGITVHLREDRRHINDQDVLEIDNYLRQSIKPKLGLTFEMGATHEIRAICLKTKSKLATIVPEKRQELTTEGGLDVSSQRVFLQEFIKPIQDNGIKISFFVDPVIEQLESSKVIGAEFVELHTGTYANLFAKYHSDKATLGYLPELPEAIKFADLVMPVQDEILRIKVAVDYAQSIGLKTNLGHGLTVPNLTPLLEQLSSIQELHIGHSVISNAIYYGIPEITRLMLKVIASLAK